MDVREWMVEQGYGNPSEDATDALQAVDFKDRAKAFLAGTSAADYAATIIETEKSIPCD